MSNIDATYPFVSEEAREKYLSYCCERSKSWPRLENKEEKFIDTTYGRTFIRIGGPQNAPPLLLVPGDEETSLAFAYIVEPLSKEFRIYSLDRIGDVGQSIPNPEKPILSTHDIVKWLDQVVITLMDLSEGKSVSIVAHSYGAWQVSLYAAAYPMRVEMMALLAPTATVLPTRIGLLIRAIIYSIIPLRSIKWWHTNWFDPISVKQKDSREYLCGVIEENALAKKCFSHRKVFILPTTLAEEEWQTINSIPTLFLVGDGEVMYSSDQLSDKLNRVAPAVECNVVPGADHHMMIVNPDWVSSALVNFLGEKK